MRMQKRSATPVSGAPLDGAHDERADGVASAAEVQVASGNNVEDKQKDAIDAVREEVVEGDEPSALELEDAEATLEGQCKVTEGVCEITHDEPVTGHVSKFASGTSGTDATRGASSPSINTIDAMGST